MRLGAHRKPALRSLLPALAALVACQLLLLPAQGRIGSASNAPSLSIANPEMGPSEYNYATFASWQMRKLYPVDEASKDPSFKAFRDGLLDAVKRKDTQFILNSIAPDIQNDFGGGNGKENFKAKWRLGKVSESNLWPVLDAILSMGGTFRVEQGKRSFWAPYVYSAWPDDFECGEDAQCYAVTGENVNVRREPASSAPIVASLSYDIVKSRSEDPASAKAPEGWTRIIIVGGGTGYVATKFIRSSEDYRAGFAQMRGKWLMTALLAGD